MRSNSSSDDPAPEPADADVDVVNPDLASRFLTLHYKVKAY